MVVGATTFTVFRYAWEISAARNELNALNLSLEDRVNRRTAQLTEARDRAELLVAEVNHRVANSLSLVASLVRLQSNVITDQGVQGCAEGNRGKNSRGRLGAQAIVQRR